MIIQKLDLHAHVMLEREYGPIGLTCEELRVMYDRIGVEKGVALPIVSPEYEADQFSVRAARIRPHRAMYFMRASRALKGYSSIAIFSSLFSSYQGRIDSARPAPGNYLHYSRSNKL